MFSATAHLCLRFSGDHAVTQSCCELIQIPVLQIISLFAAQRSFLFPRERGPVAVAKQNNFYKYFSNNN